MEQENDFNIGDTVAVEFSNGSIKQGLVTKVNDATLVVQLNVFPMQIVCPKKYRCKLLQTAP
jgi:primosomal protein N'